MSSQTYTYPSGTTAAYSPYWLEAFSLKVEDMVLVSQPSLGGPIRTYEIPGTWLVASMTYGMQTTAERQEIIGWWAAAGLRRNRVRLHHPLYVAPRGTMRGSPTVNGTVAPGAESVTLAGTGAAVGTLLRGDLIGLTDGLHVVTADCSVPGAVPISPNIRSTVSNGSAVTWDRPTQTFVVLGAPDIPVQGSGPHPGFTVQLVEAP